MDKKSKAKERPKSATKKLVNKSGAQATNNANIDYAEVKRKLNEGNLQLAKPINKSNSKGPSKTQIERLKKFYGTTRWLPNSAFTTYFGKPAFENYGFANTNPVYGGLFYGNYMLSYNMNPIDGPNHPEEKQVYSSAMMKSCQRKAVRRPSPPRKCPEEIRNTPEELQEIRTRKQIFQLPNNFPSRDIIPPNLLKARRFRSGRNTPENSIDENEDEYEDWNIENILNGKRNKKLKLKNKTGMTGFNPYNQGKVQLKRKKMKEDIDNKFDDDFYQRAEERRMKKHGMYAGQTGEEDEYDDNPYFEVEEKSEGELEYERQKDYYTKMLGAEAIKNLEDLTNLQVQKEQEFKENLNKIKAENVDNYNKTVECNCNNCQYCIKKREEKTLLSKLDKTTTILNQQKYGCGCARCQCNTCGICNPGLLSENEYKNKIIEYKELKIMNPEITNPHKCLCYCDLCNLCRQMCNDIYLKYENKQKEEAMIRMRKHENPALLPPSSDLLKFDNCSNKNFVCCVHHSMLPFNEQERNPRNYQGMPACMMSAVVPAGKPSHLVAPLNIFQN